MLSYLNNLERVRNQVTTTESTMETITIAANPQGFPVRGIPNIPFWKFMPYMEKISVGMESVIEMMVKMRITLLTLFDTIEAKASVIPERTPE